MGKFLLNNTKYKEFKHDKTNITQDSDQRG